MPDSQHDALRLSGHAAPDLRQTRLVDYRPPSFLADTVALHVTLDPAATEVRARIAFRRNPEADGGATLWLDGIELTLLTISLDGAALAPEHYRQDAAGLTLTDLPDAFLLETVVRIAPAANTQLSGLYTSGGSFFTQCEAEGFRRITFFPDRPDVMARYTVTLDAERAAAPVLLSNGNLVAAGDGADGRHWARFEDPHPKPCYLFALVAGDLLAVRSAFRTRSGRDVALAIWVRPGDERSCDHAMAACRRAMLWDEDTFGLEYDLDAFNIAAVADFNMGAMENKGLNVFNTSLVLARPETATDEDYASIERVIAHEYFHNWTGNRVTCRDWFQLSLKEGLTVLRDQLYCEAVGSAALRRIQEVDVLRALQFREDAGPLAHPVRPQSYVAIDNFYTPTVYRKGAELVRMIRTLIGAEAFVRGMALYVARHDNQAVTIEDFVRAMEDAAGADLRSFRAWYDQAGTPVVTVEQAHDAASGRFTLRLSQHTPPTPGQAETRPLPIPVALGLLGADGRELPIRLHGEDHGEGTTRVVVLSEATQEFVFEGLVASPVPSLLRGFSAPVRLMGVPDEQLRFLAARDSDPFVRRDSAQLYASNAILAALGTSDAAFAPLAEIAGEILEAATADAGFAAEALRLPSHGLLAQAMAVADHPAIHAAREAALGAIGRAHLRRWRALYEALADTDPAATDDAAAGRRALRNLSLARIAQAEPVDGAALAAAQVAAGRCMTEVLAGLQVLCGLDCAERQPALDGFAARWHGDALVMDKWFAVQAGSPLPDAIERVGALIARPDYDRRNPNRVRSLLASFMGGNLVRFHAADGQGYALLADELIAIDRINGQSAARLFGGLAGWRGQEPGRRALMRAQLERLRETPGLSRWTAEKVALALA